MTTPVTYVIFLLLLWMVVGRHGPLGLHAASVVVVVTCLEGELAQILRPYTVGHLAMGQVKKALLATLVHVP